MEEYSPSQHQASWLVLRSIHDGVSKMLSEDELEYVKSIGDVFAAHEYLVSIGEIDRDDPLPLWV